LCSMTILIRTYQKLAILFFFFLRYCGLNSGPMPWATPPALFCDGFFRNRVSQTICQGWLQTTTLPISTSWVARITGGATGTLQKTCHSFCCLDPKHLSPLTAFISQERTSINNALVSCLSKWAQIVWCPPPGLLSDPSFSFP
jgi:hypothetical protein